MKITKKDITKEVERLLPDFFSCQIVDIKNPPAFSLIIKTKVRDKTFAFQHIFLFRELIEFNRNWKELIKLQLKYSLCQLMIMTIDELEKVKRRLKCGGDTLNPE